MGRVMLADVASYLDISGLHVAMMIFWIRMFSHAELLLLTI